jgi:predicted lipoprotein with Yx(FWY)xxD motif
MTRSAKAGGRVGGLHRGKRFVAIVIIGTAGFGVAALTGLAVAKSFTLAVVKNAKVTNTKGVTKHENVVSNAHGVSVYTLTHDTIQHPGCTKANGCFAFWFPVTVPSKSSKLTKAPGVKGKLGTFHRNGFFQVTLDKHPLYTFKFDNKHKGVATGEGIANFGGIWHVEQASGASKSTTTSSSTSTSTSTGYTYPPGY